MCIAIKYHNTSNLGAQTYWLKSSKMSSAKYQSLICCLCKERSTTFQRWLSIFYQQYIYCGTATRSAWTSQHTSLTSPSPSQLTEHSQNRIGDAISKSIRDVGMSMSISWRRDLRNSLQIMQYNIIIEVDCNEVNV